MISLAAILNAFRLYQTTGVPASGPNHPSKAEILAAFTALGSEYDTAIAGLQSQISVAGPQVRRGIVSGYTDIGVHPVVVQAGAGPGRVTLNHTPYSYATHRNNVLSAASNVAYVDDENGSDANPGTSALPYKTLTYAGSTSTAQIIRVRPGTYAPPTINITDAAFAGGRSLKMFFLDPGVTIATAGPRLQDQTWTLHSGTVNIDAVYKTTLTLTGAQIVQRVARRDLFDPVAGQPVTFTQYSSAANLIASSASTSGWYTDTTSGNKTIYVRLAGGASVITNKTVLKAFYLDSNFDANWNVKGVPCLIQAVVPGTVLFDGVGVIGTDVTGSIGEVYAEGLFSRFGPVCSYQTHGGINFFKNCVGHGSVTDIFNYNAGVISNSPSQNIEHDCRGTNAGDIDTYGTGVAPNRNGSSVHDFVDILRVGCFYENCWGPIVADIANAATGTSWNIGVICGPTTEPQNIGFFSSDAGRKSYWDQCYAYGNTTAISATGGVNKANNCVFDGATVGTVNTYNPVTGI